MLNIFEQTLSKAISFEGIGLHTGEKSRIKILPGEAGKGIIFKRIDLAKNNIIKANYNNVSSAKLCTTLENSHGIKVSTVEHLLAALYIAEIDCAVIEIDSEEVPIMDGSAKHFLNEIKKIKVRKLQRKRKYLKILDKVELQDGKRFISIEPAEISLSVNFKLNYENKIIGNQENTINFEKDNLLDIADARTFCLLKDIEKIKEIGLAKGGTLANAIVVDENKIVNESGLRNKKEFVNHKILDLVGDFLLSGYRILGRVSCNQGGHELTNMFLRKLFNSSQSFQVFEIEDMIISKKTSSNQSFKLAASA